MGLWIHILVGCVVFILILLILRTTYLNKRLNEVDDYLTDCVTKDRLQQLIILCMEQALESKGAN